MLLREIQRGRGRERETKDRQGEMRIEICRRKNKEGHIFVVEYRMFTR